MALVVVEDRVSVVVRPQSSVGVHLLIFGGDPGERTACWLSADIGTCQIDVSSSRAAEKGPRLVSAAAEGPGERWKEQRNRNWRVLAEGQQWHLSATGATVITECHRLPD